MQLKIRIHLKEPCILPLSYHHIVQSVLYNLMKEPGAEDSVYHNSGAYHEKRVYRLFTFGLLKGNYQIRGKQIIFSDSIRFEVRSALEDCLRLAEWNLRECGIWINGTQYEEIDAELRRDTVKESGMYIYMDSPICVYSTDRETRQTTFFTPYEERFTEAVNRNFMRKYQAAFGETPDAGIELRAVEIKAKDKYVTKYKGYYISGWKGRYYLSGEAKYLDFLYQTGLGAKNSQGFGMFCIEP